MEDITRSLESEHREIEAAFAAYDWANAEDSVANLKELLEHHTSEEESKLYPEMEDEFPDHIEHAKEEHDKADKLLASLADDPENKELFAELREAIAHHVEEEEQRLFPNVRTLAAQKVDQDAQKSAAKEEEAPRKAAEKPAKAEKRHQDSADKKDATPSDSGDDH